MQSESNPVPELLVVNKLPRPMYDTFLLRLSQEEKELILDALKAFSGEWSDTFNEAGRPKGGIRVIAEHVFRVLSELNAKIRDAPREQLVA